MEHAFYINMCRSLIQWIDQNPELESNRAAIEQMIQDLQNLIDITRQA